MLVNFDCRVCYLANPKTASQTTAIALREHSGFLPVSDHHDGWDAGYGTRDVVEMGMDAEARMVWLWGDPERFLYFHVIRNPFDTLASWFEISKSEIRFDSIGPEWWTAFKARKNKKHFPPTGLFPYVYRRPPGPFGTIRYEELNETLSNLAVTFGFPDPGELPIIGATKGKRPYREYFDAMARTWVEENFAADLQAGGYTF